MGIDAKFEIEKEKFVTLADGRWYSKAIASFILEPLMNYCKLKGASNPLKDLEKEIDEWFSSITSRMGEDLCLLEKIMYNYWDYSEDEYERYFNEMKWAFEMDKNPGIPDWLADRPDIDDAVQAAKNRGYIILSEEEFLNTCREIEQKWVDINLVQKTIADLLRVIDEIHPPETWWYNEKDTLSDFRLFSQALSQASEMGYQKVRIYCS